MANEEHLERLLQGVEKWNQWRDENQVQPELNRTELNGANLSGANLSGANLSGANLGAANLSAANLSAVNLSGANLSGADLRAANLNGTDLRGAYLRGAYLIEADLREADLRETYLRETYLKGADLSRADLRYLDLCRVKLNGTKLNGADLSGADLRQIDFSEVNFREVSLSGANLRGANLRSATLLKVNLSEIYLSRSNLAATNLCQVDLSRSDLSQANLSEVDWTQVNLYQANLRGVDLSTANLTQVNLCEADLSKANLSQANLQEASLQKAILSEVNFDNTSLVDADLSGVNLRGVNLRGADLSGANLGGTDLSDMNLSGMDLSGMDLSDTDLRCTQALGANFNESIFTGACLEDWNINSATSFDGAICEYVYLKANQQERRPREGTFKPGEFAALFQQAVDTVDLIFRDGIDWQAFFQSFQDLHSQYADQDLSIQAIEKKRGGAFVVRVEVAEGADKAAIESRAKELYAIEVKALEVQYEARLRLQGEHLEDARQTIEVERRDKATLMGVMATLASTQQGPKYDMRGAQIAGGVADTVQGSQYGGTINNYGPNTEDITRLLTTLRDQAQTFPTVQKDEANDALDLLELDLTKPEPDQGRIGRRLKKLLAIATLLTDLNDFTNNVIELTEKLGIPIEQVQLPPSSNP